MLLLCMLLIMVLVFGVVADVGGVDGVDVVSGASGVVVCHDVDVGDNVVFGNAGVGGVVDGVGGCVHIGVCCVLVLVSLLSVGFVCWHELWHGECGVVV